ncbi:putative amino acid transporter, transmembrane domain-containing protein [Dioscorea sansibarensis]
MIAIICCYTGLLLKQCMDANPRIRTYTDIGGLAFGNKGRLAVLVFMNIELFLVSFGFLILEGDTLNKDVSFIILPRTWLRNLSVLAYVSAGGVLALTVMVGSVFWTATFGGFGFLELGRPLNIVGLPTSLGLFTFCYCGHVVFPTICNSMKNKAQFSKVMVLYFVLCTINYASMAVIGYLMYGIEVQSQITLNLPLRHLSSKILIYTKKDFYLITRDVFRSV